MANDIISNLYKEDFYLNKNIPYLFNVPIIEYDMKEAGFSLIREFKQLPQDKIDYLNSIKSKDERKIQIGNYERADPAFKKIHLESFITARQLFFIANDISDNDIISIKKDAIITCKICKENKVGDYINFRSKNKYTSYLRPSKPYDKLEFYYNPSQLDVKGISDENYEKHKNGILKFINTFFRKMETEEETKVLDYLRNFITKYKRYELPLEYYRTFDYRSCFVTKRNELFDEYWEEDKRDLDLNYNYNILLSIIKVLV